jgi:hypothetical protein
MRSGCTAILAGLALVPGLAGAENLTSGGCSPVVSDTTGNVSITLNCNFGGDSGETFDVELIRATLACNSAVERRDIAEGNLARGGPLDSARDLFRRLQGLDDEFVYVDLSIWVGYGCGLADVAEEPPPTWGVVYQLAEYLDGFTGNDAAYAYGYHIDYPNFTDEIGDNRTSTLLLTRSDDAFFTARYGKAMTLEGVAKVRITGIQGFQFIELVPATPIGGLAQHYARFKRYLKSAFP